MKKSFADILGGLDAETERRTGRKLPAWTSASAARKAAGLAPLEIPSTLSLEQCSSEQTAIFKRSLLAGLFPDGIGTLCDLTCGLGIDSLAFSAIARQVISYERAPELARAAERNFKKLGAGNIEVRNEEVGPSVELPECDVIFADPARRDGAGRKVFRLEDCSPDIRPLLPTLLSKAGIVLLKLSPMADISLIATELGESLEQVHIIGLHSEVKELLCLLRRGHSGTYTITARELGAMELETRELGARELEAREFEARELGAAELGAAAEASAPFSFTPSGPATPGADPADSGTCSTGTFSFTPSGPATPGADPADSGTCSTGTFSFTPEEERDAEAVYCPEPQPGQLLLEPRGALMKSGAYKLICSRFGLAKLAPSTHLYVGRTATEGKPDATQAGTPADKGMLTADCQPGGNSGVGATANTVEAGTALAGMPVALFKVFRISEVHPFNGQTVKALGKLYPDAEVSARNLPLSSDELRGRMKVRGGGTRHIFGCSTSGGKLLIVAEILR